MNTLSTISTISTLGTTNWQTLAGPKHLFSMVAKNSDGRLELFALAEDGTLEHCWQSAPGDPTTWSDWHSLGKGAWDEAGPTSFTVVLSNKGCLEVFLVADGNSGEHGNGAAPNRSGQIFHNSQSAPSQDARDAGGGMWAGWHDLDARYANGWSTAIGVTAVRNADGRLNLFVMSANRGVLEEKWWSDYTNSTMIGHYQQTERGQWNGPELRISIETCIEVEGRPDYSCKSRLPVKLAAALNSDGRFELFANAGGLDAKRRGRQGITCIPAYLWHARQTSEHGKNWGTSDFPLPPTPTMPTVPHVAIDSTTTRYEDQATQPSAILNHEGNLELYMWGNVDHNVWVLKQDPTVAGRWLPWRSIGDSKEWRHPVVVANQNNVLTVLAVDMTSNGIWYLDQFLNNEDQAVWSSEWQPISENEDATDTRLLHAIIDHDGRIELFASGPDNVGFRHRYQTTPGKWR